MKLKFNMNKEGKVSQVLKCIHTHIVILKALLSREAEVTKFC